MSLEIKYDGKTINGSKLPKIGMRTAVGVFELLGTSSAVLANMSTDIVEILKAKPKRRRIKK